MNKIELTNELKRSEDEYHQIFENMHEGFVYFEVFKDLEKNRNDYKFIDINPVFEKLQNLNKNDIIGKSVYDVLPENNDFIYLTSTFDKMIVNNSYYKAVRFSSYYNKWFWLNCFLVKNNKLVILFNDISTSKSNEERLSESDLFKNLMIESSPLGILTFDDNGQCNSCNHSAAKLVGAPKEEILKMNFYYIPSWRKYGLYEMAINSLEKNSPYDKILDIKTTFDKDISAHCYFSSFYVKGKKHLLLMMSDETEKRNITLERNRFFSTSLALLCKFNRNSGYFELLNHTCKKLLGYSESELLNRKFIDFVHKDDIPETVKVLEDLNSKLDISNFINRYKTKYGTYIWFSWDFAVFDNDIYASAIDITRLKQREIDLTRSKLEADQATKSKDSFFTNVSHELKTPINSIISYSEMLTLELQDEKYKNYTDNIKIAGFNLLSAINDILDFSKITSGILEISNSPTNLIDIFDEIYNLFILSIKQKGLSFYVDIPDGFPNIILIDETRLRQVLINIIGNAVKFTLKGYVRLSVSIHEISNDRISFIISIKDTGIGIPKDSHDIIFNSFAKIPSELTKKSIGTSLGLSISKKLVELMNGKIELVSEIGDGTTFLLKFNDLEIYKIQ